MFQRGEIDKKKVEKLGENSFHAANSSKTTFLCSMSHRVVEIFPSSFTGLIPTNLFMHTVIFRPLLTETPKKNLRNNRQGTYFNCL
jgi:hypothetical protein